MESEQVEQADYEYGCILTQILFGPTGLIDTLGPTWTMVMDPRFAKIENLFIVDHPARFGGDARQGVQTQLADGTFSGGYSLDQYSEILTEGRFLHKVLRSHAIINAVDKLYPAKKLSEPLKGDELFGLTLVGPYSPDVLAELKKAVQAVAVSEGGITAEPADDEIAEYASLLAPDSFAAQGILSPYEKLQVLAEAERDDSFAPGCLKDWTDGAVWELLREYYPNYFSREGTPNQKAKTLHALIKADLVGLIDDYAEIANIQETVLLEDFNTLYEPAIHGPYADRVSAEFEILERALDYRAEVRVLTVKILASLGADRVADGIGLTDLERDELTRIVFAYDWPEDGRPEPTFRKQWSDEKPILVTRVLSYLFNIKHNPLPVEVRTMKQREVSQSAAKAHVDKLRSGELLPITRETDGVVETQSPWDEAQAQILSNPIALSLRSKLNALETCFMRLLKASKEAEPESAAQAAAEADVVRVWTAINILEPVLHFGDFSALTEEAAEALLAKVEELYPTSVPVLAEHESYYPALTIQ